MVIIEKKHIKGIPLLEVVKKELSHHPLPLVFFFHGFTSVKEVNLHYAYFLAQKNIRVVLPEADYHGERSRNVGMLEMSVHFWDIVLQNITELGELKEEYERAGRIDSDNIGVAGTSMGGVTTLGALTQYDWITAGVSLMGNPAYERFARFLVDQVKARGEQLPLSDEQLEEAYAKLVPYDLSRQPEKLNNRPFLFWHGKKDPVVPYEDAYRLYQEVKGHYSDPEKIQFILDEHAEHKVSKEGVAALVAWFDKHLKQI